MSALAQKLNVATEGRDLVLTRQFDAPRALVYRAWIDPQMLADWFAPEGFKARAELDLRPGGALRIVMIGPDGDYPITGRFVDIVENQRLVMTFSAAEHPAAWHDMIHRAYVEAGGGDADTRADILTKVTFADAADATVVTVRQTFPDVHMRQAHEKLGNPTGWGGSFDKLEALLARTS